MLPRCSQSPVNEKRESLKITPGTSLPAAPCKLSATQLMNMPMTAGDPQLRGLGAATLEIRDLDSVRELPGEAAVAPVGITCTSNIPIVPQKSAANSVHAIGGRVLRPTIRNDDPFFSQPLMHQFLKYARSHGVLRDIGITEGCVTVMPFAEWNARFPKGMQAVNILALERVEKGLYSPKHIDSHGAFVKSEGLPKSQLVYDPEEFADFTARNILSCMPEENVITGPTCLSVSRYLATVWVPTSTYGLVYAMGLSAEQIGDAAQRHSTHLGEDLVTEEGDLNDLIATCTKRNWLLRLGLSTS